MSLINSPFISFRAEETLFVLYVMLVITPNGSTCNTLSASTNFHRQVPKHPISRLAWLRVIPPSKHVPPFNSIGASRLRVVCSLCLVQEQATRPYAVTE